MFRHKDIPKNMSVDLEPPQYKVIMTIPINIDTEDDPKMLYIGAQCTEQEKEKFTTIFREFIDLFVWSYKDLYNFNPGVIQHSIPLEEGVMPDRNRQRQVNPILKARCAYQKEARQYAR